MRKKITLIYIGLWMIFFCLSAQQVIPGFDLNVNGTLYRPVPNAKEFLASQSTKLRSSSTADSYMVMQFSELPSQSEINDLKKSGITLLDYLQHNAYYVRISAQPNLRSKSLDKLYSVFSTNELNKINAQLKSEELPQHALLSKGVVRLMVTYLQGVTDSDIEQEVLKKFVHSNYKLIKEFNQFEIATDIYNINQLAAVSWIINISPIAPEYQLFDYQENASAAILRYNQDHPALTGKGVKVGIWDSNVEKHIDLQGRINQNWLGYESSSHGIHVAGIVAGDGTKDPVARGAAPGAQLETYNYNSLPDGVYSVAQQMLDSYKNKKINVTQNSYGYLNEEGRKWSYDYDNRNTDVVANQCPELLHVYACGNNAARGAFWSTGTNPSKNTIQVANLAYTSDLYPSSSRGPDLTGQIFPHVAAVGYNVWSLSYNNQYEYMTGTSMSCPLVSGFASLIYEKYLQLNNNKYPQASLVKALICNGTTDLDKPGPDYNTGFGEVNLNSSIEMLENHQYIVDSIRNTGNIKEFEVNVPNNLYELKVMLVWNDPYGTPGLGNTLVNDLDLEVEAGRTYRPLVLDPYHPDNAAIEGVDNLNVMEQVVIKNPVSGKVKIRVKGSAVPKPAQTFSVVYSFVKKGIVLLSPVNGDVFNAGAIHSIKWQSFGLEGDAIVESSTDGGNTYKILATVSGKNIINIQTKNNLEKSLRFRVSQGGMFSESVDISVIGRPASLTSALVDGQNKLTWRKATGAASYEILRLKEDDSKTYEVISESTDTTFVVPSSYCDQPYWFTVRAKNENISGMRAVAVKLQATTAMSTLPIKFDFEKEIPNLVITNGKNSICTYRNIPELNNTGVLFFMGNLTFANNAAFTDNWKTVAKPTASKVWEYNPASISSASFKVNLPAGKKALMKFKIRIKSSYPYFSFFRVLVNGTIIPDATGRTQYSHNDLYVSDGSAYSAYYNPRYNPVSYADYFIERYYDLSQYEGRNDLTITLEGLCATKRYIVANDPDGSQVYIDDLEITEQKPVELVISDMATNIQSGNALAPTKVDVNVVNVGYQASVTSQLKMVVDEYKSGNSTQSEVALPELAPWKQTTVPAGTATWKTPESHKLSFITLNNQNGDLQSDTLSVAYVESKNKNEFRLIPSDNIVQMEPIRQDTTITDYGSSIYPYPKINQRILLYPNDGTKLLEVSFSEMDLAPGDTIHILSGNTVISKYYGNNTGTPCRSIAPDGSFTFFLNSKGGDAKEKGWIGRLKLIDKEIKKDLKIEDVKYTVNNQSWADGVAVSMIVANNGSDSIPLDFDVNYQVKGLPKVTETPVFYEYSDAAGILSTQMNVLKPGRKVGMVFNTRITGNTIEVNKEHPITLNIPLDDENIENNTLNTTVFYGNGSNPGDPYAYGFVKKFTLGNYLYESLDYGYTDNTKNVLLIEYGKTYPYEILLDGFYAKEAQAVFYVDTNNNGVFEDNNERFALKGEDTENRNTYTGDFVPQAYFPAPGTYKFRVEAYHSDNHRSAIDYVVKVSGDPINNDVDLQAVSMNDSIVKGAENDVTLNILRYFSTIPSTPVTVSYEFVNANGQSVYNGIIEDIAPLKKDAQTRLFKFITPSVQEGSYTLKITLNAGDEFKDNNTQKVQVYVKDAVLLYATTINGGIGYSAALLQPGLGAIIPSEYSPFAVSNMNDATWVKDESKNIDHWFMLSEQFTRAWDNKTFYENKLVRFEFGAPKSQFVPLANSFNSFRIHAIAFDYTNKILYGLGVNVEAKPALYSIDYETGSAAYLRDLNTESQLSGLAADLHGTLFSVNKTSGKIVTINPTSGMTSDYCALSDHSSNRFNLVYDVNTASLYVGNVNAAGENILYKAIPVEGRTIQVSSFGPNNQPYCMAMPVTSISQAASKLFMLESFNVEGQLTSVVDNNRKEVTIYMPTSANLGNLKASYYFANGNALFYNGTTLVTEATPLDLTQTISLKAKAVSPNTQAASWTIIVRQDLGSDIYLQEFGFKKEQNPVLANDVAAVITPNGATCTLPYNVDLSSLIPSFQSNLPKGAETAKVLNQIVKSDIDVINFESPVLMNLTSVQMGVQRNYKIEVTRQLSPKNQLLSFTLLASVNTGLVSTIDGIVDGTNIIIQIPDGQSVNDLVASFVLSDYAKAYFVSNGQQIISGASKFDLSAPVQIKVVSEDGQNEQIYTIQLSIVTGIDDLQVTALSVYPNPVQSKLFIRSDKNMKNVFVYDANGSVVYSSSLNDLRETFILTDAWTKGVYFVKVETSGGVQTVKIVKE